MPKTQKRILVALGWYDHRLHRGIEKYAQEHGWRLSEDPAREKVIPWGWEGDGILAWLGAGDDLAEFVAHSHKPTVDFSFRRPHLKFARVLEDHAQTACLVADHFLSRGHRNFLFYGDPENWVIRERGEGFVAALKDAGHSCAWIHWQKPNANGAHRSEWKQKRDWLIAQLRRAPKPLAAFGATDGHALEILEACEDADIVVPDSVAIAGAGNSLLAVDAMHTPITSVDTNMEMLGYQGAAMLDKLMRGKPQPAKPVRIPPVGIIARKSSDLLAVNHPGIARSLRFMLDHFQEPIGVGDLARVAAMSLRGFHQAFQENTGRSPGHELLRVRIERGKRLLLESDEKADAIAEMCGYNSSNSFWVAFKQITGLTPKQFQTQFRGLRS